MNMALIECSVFFRRFLIVETSAIIFLQDQCEPHNSGRLLAEDLVDVQQMCL